MILLFILILCIPASSETTTLVDLQKIALSENPRIKAMDEETRMIKKRVPQSNVLDDPKLKLGLNNLPVKTFSFTKEDMTSKEIGISQMIPLGTLGHRRSIAVKEYEKARERLRAEKVETMHMLRINYYDLIYTRASIKILEDIKKQIKLLIDSEVAAAKSGMGSLANVIKAKIEYNMTEEEIIILNQKQLELEELISYVVGKKITIDATSLPDPDFKEISIDEAQREIAASNPQLKMLFIDMEISGYEISLKKTEYAPNVDIGLSYMQRQDGRTRRMVDPMIGMDGQLTPTYKTEKMKRDDMVSFMATFNVPFWFWKKNMPIVDEMKIKNSSIKHFYQDRLNNMNARAVILASQLAKWRDLYKLYQGKLIPQTELAMETNLARYRTSTVEFMPVVDTVRMLLKYKKELAMAIKEYRTAYSELFAMMGVVVLP